MSPRARPPEAGLPRRDTRLAFVPSMPALAGMEPRHSLPVGDRSVCSSTEGQP
jgi:hypothetical protein